MPPSLPVIIVGAGVSGLALAQGLCKHGIPFRLFERDASLTARAQGYRFRISDEGIRALEQNLPSERFEKFKRSCGLNAGTSNAPQIHLDANTGEPGELLFPPGSKAPSVFQTQEPPLSADRTLLRKILLDGIEESVEFGKQFESYEEHTDHVAVRFADGHETRGSVLVGADGAWSRVRQQLIPGYKLLDTEGRLLFGKTNITEDFVQQFSSKAMTGLTLIREPGLRCLLEPMRFNKDMKDLADDYVYWVLFLRNDVKANGKDLLSLSGDETTDFANHLTSHWHPTFRPLFHLSNSGQTSVIRIVSTHPEISTWAETSRVTLTGDAIHAMAPTAAIGATTALQDSGLLTRMLDQYGTENEVEALRKYESSMRKYANEAVNKTLAGGKAMFGMKPLTELPEIDLGC